MCIRDSEPKYFPDLMETCYFINQLDKGTYLYSEIFWRYAIFRPEMWNLTVVIWSSFAWFSRCHNFGTKITDFHFFSPVTFWRQSTRKFESAPMVRHECYLVQELTRLSQPLTPTPWTHVVSWPTFIAFFDNGNFRSVIHSVHSVYYLAIY